MTSTFTPPRGPTTNGPAGRGSRLAPVPRRRNLPLVAVGTVLIVGLGLLGASLVRAAGNRDAVLAVSRAVAAGSVIGDADLGVARISADPSLRPLPARDRARVVGRTASVSLLPGMLVTDNALGEASELGPGRATVGLSLKPGQVPAKLRTGDEVMVVATGAAADALSPPENAGPTGGGQNPRGAVLVERARVSEVTQPSGNDARLSLVSVVVPVEDAPAVAGAANVGQVVLVLQAARRR